MTLDSRLATVVDAARSKKAFRIRLVDVKEIASFTDVMAFMSGGSDRQNRAIAEAVEDGLKLTGERPISREGESNGNWVLLDYGNLVVHVMDEETRRHYNLEALTQREPGTQWILLMGSDQLPGLAQWRRVERVFQLASAAVALRPGTPFLVPDLPDLRTVTTWSGAPGEILALPATELDLASSDLRERLHRAPQEDPAGLPPQVLGTIRTENLYR